jgi:heme/copper-type cytochrome/quinol oxidase subunit 1
VRHPTWARVAPALVIVVIIIGVVVTGSGTPLSASFGWFAYAPLSEATFSPHGGVIVTWSAVVGATTIAAGTALLGLRPDLSSEAPAPGLERSRQPLAVLK